MAIDTALDPNHEINLVPRGTQERVWALREGLSEDEDFMYLSEDGWLKLVAR